MSSSPEISAGTSAFISHSSADAVLAGHLCEALESHGIRCWIAPRDVMHGRSWADECVRGIEQSSAFVLLASASAISSIEVLSEVEQAHKRGKPLYTVLIGKPKLNKELDYYISRLHWIEYAGDSVDTLATRLTKVLSGRQTWNDVASPPSLRRTVLYRRDAFSGAAIASALVLVLGIAAGLWWLNWHLDHDYRRLGYVSLSAESITKGQVDPVTVRAEVWLLAEGVPFRDVTLNTAVLESQGAIERSDHSQWTKPQQVGSMEFVEFALAPAARQLTTCLSVGADQKRFRVTQTFILQPSNGTVAISPTSEPKVTRDDGSTCGPLS